MDGNIAKAVELEIDKTFAAIAETNKSAGTALASYVVSLLTAIALTFGQGFNLPDRVGVPLLQLTVDRRLAAGIALLLSSASLYRWMLCATMEGILVRELENALRRRYGAAIKGRFFYRHTSIIRMTTVVFEGSRRISRIFTLLLILATLVGVFMLPSVLMWSLTQTAHLPAWQNLLLLLIGAVSTLPAFLIIATHATHQQDTESESASDSLLRKTLYTVTGVAYVLWLGLLWGGWVAGATRVTLLVTLTFAIVAAAALIAHLWALTGEAEVRK